MTRAYPPRTPVLAALVVGATAVRSPIGTTVLAVASTFLSARGGRTSPAVTPPPST